MGTTPGGLPESHNINCDIYLFKGKLDAFLYLLVYFALPLYSIIKGINNEDGAIYFTALSCCLCVIYDCYSRYDENGRKSKIRKLYAIGIIHGLLALYTFWGIQEYYNNKALLPQWVYILLAVAPIIGGIDLGKMIRDDSRSRAD